MGSVEAIEILVKEAEECLPSPTSDYELQRIKDFLAFATSDEKIRRRLDLMVDYYHELKNAEKNQREVKEWQGGLQALINGADPEPYNF